MTGQHADPGEPLRARVARRVGPPVRQLYARWHPLRQRIGRRGAGLFVFCVLDEAFAWSLLDGSPTGPRSVASYRFAHDLAPYMMWAAMWATVGVVCAVSALLPRQRVAFAMAIAVKMLWALLLMATWTVYQVPRAYVGGVQWLALAAAALIFSGIPDSGRRR